MNIFILDKDPEKAAEMLDDKRVVKMILESFQLLATAHRVLDGEEYFDFSKNGRKIKRFKLKDENLDKLLPKATHLNHPCNIWVRKSSSNYIWLYQYAITLLNQFELRFKKQHSFIKLIKVMNKLPNNIEIKALTRFALAMPEKYQFKDEVSSYREYFLKEKLKTAQWNKLNNIPNWVK